jgi:hemoglobin
MQVRALRSPVVLCLTVLGSQIAAPRTAAEAADSLYKRLGGYDAIAAVVDDFIPRLATDPALGKFFIGASKDSQGRIRQLVVDQICAAAGGPCIYLGRSMKVAHAGLGITDSDWQTSVKHLIASLDKFKVPAKEKDDLIAVVGSLKADIVEKP